MKIPNLRYRIAFLLAATALLAAPLIAIDCHHFSNSTATHFDGYGFVCAGTGQGCTECIDVIDVGG